MDTAGTEVCQTSVPLAAMVEGGLRRASDAVMRLREPDLALGANRNPADGSKKNIYLLVSSAGLRLASAGHLLLTLPGPQAREGITAGYASRRPSATASDGNEVWQTSSPACPGTLRYLIDRRTPVVRYLTVPNIYKVLRDPRYGTLRYLIYV